MKSKLVPESRIERIHRLNKERLKGCPSLTANDLLKLKRIKDLIFGNLGKVVHDQNEYRQFIVQKAK